jgi:hypothetical protein
MFSLENQQAKIASFNPRAEKHGDENVPSGDLKLEVTCANSVLDHFDKALRKMLYRKPGAGEQTDLPLNDHDGLTARKFPHLSPLKWDEDFPGYTLSIDSGFGIKDALVLEDVELSNFAFEALDGGSVNVTFRASFHPEPDQSGALCSMIQETVEITLTPPDADGSAQQQMAA